MPFFKLNAEKCILNRLTLKKKYSLSKGTNTDDVKDPTPLEYDVDLLQKVVKRITEKVEDIRIGFGYESITEKMLNKVKNCRKLLKEIETDGMTLSQIFIEKGKRTLFYNFDLLVTFQCYPMLIF